jgi:hypothetical protein
MTNFSVYFFFIIHSLSLYGNNSIRGVFGFELGETLDFQSTLEEKFSIGSYLVNPTDSKLKFEEYIVEINPITKEIWSIYGEIYTSEQDEFRGGEIIQGPLKKQFSELQIALTHKYGEPEYESGIKERVFSWETSDCFYDYYTFKDGNNLNRKIELQSEKKGRRTLYSIAYIDTKAHRRAEVAMEIISDHERKAKEKKILRNINYLDDL